MAGFPNDTLLKCHHWDHCCGCCHYSLASLTDSDASHTGLTSHIRVLWWIGFSGIKWIIHCQTKQDQVLSTWMAWSLVGVHRSQMPKNGSILIAQAFRMPGLGMGSCCTYPQMETTFVAVHRGLQEGWAILTGNAICHPSDIWHHSGILVTSASLIICMACVEVFHTTTGDLEGWNGTTLCTTWPIAFTCCT